MGRVLTAPVKAAVRAGEDADGRHGALSCCLGTAPIAASDGDLQAAGDRRRTRHEPEHSGGWRPGGFLASRGMALAPGEESCPGAVAAEAIEASAVLRLSRIPLVTVHL